MSKPEERGKLFGIIGGVGGFGLIIGPVIGGIVAGISYAAPLYMSAAILFATTVWGFFVIPESLPPQHRTATSTFRSGVAGRNGASLGGR